MYQGMGDFILAVSSYAVRLHLVWVFPANVTGSQKGWKGGRGVQIARDPLVQNQGALQAHPRTGIIYHPSGNFGHRGQLDLSFCAFFF